ncbi:CHAD domain-containing protein [Aeoliella sp. ICT_H6.2]|uniref:CHAD domain-containing protein n=1 Tax=Aeoliella straminimaris TaxID=2954799 RepID=A0A9X2FAK3_9BACT|nr:CHAD domain-containing protein [Aeoliella straminimaris]MCO6044587.1 CHAD domain-containing protein [Aeoliella straminimaris]
MGAIDKWVSEASADTPTGKVAQRALELRFRDVIHFLPLAAHLADEDMEYVHQARVATRRAAAALAMFRAFVPPAKCKQMKAMLKQFRKSMDEARDLDVYLERFGAAEEPAAGSLYDRLEHRRREVQMPIIQCASPLLYNEKFRRRAARLVSKVKKHARKRLRREPFGQWATERLQQAWARFQSAVPGDQPTADELHAFRIEIKRFRYALELLRNGLPGAARKQIYPQVKQLQAQLGEIQDHAVAADKLAAWRAEAESDAECELLQRYERDEREQYRGKSEAFLHWWRRDRLDELAAQVESLWSVTQR